MSHLTPGPDHAAPEYETVSGSEVEPKVKGAVLGAGAGVILTDFLVWSADELWWNGTEAPEVPIPVAGLIGLVVTAGLAFAGGFLARHVNRA